MIFAFIDLAKLCDDAGFPGGTSLANAVCLIAAESGRAVQATHTNDDGSVDRGLWQINDRAHPDVTDAMAFDPVQATAAAFRISKGGTDYGPWSAFKNGSYYQFMGEAKVALDGLQRIKTRDATILALRAELTVVQVKLTAETNATNAAISQLRRVENIVDQIQELAKSA